MMPWKCILVGRQYIDVQQPHTTPISAVAPPPTSTRTHDTTEIALSLKTTVCELTAIIKFTVVTFFTLFSYVPCSNDLCHQLSRIDRQLVAARQKSLSFLETAD